MGSFDRRGIYRLLDVLGFDSIQHDTQRGYILFSLFYYALKLHIEPFHLTSSAPLPPP